MNLRTQALVLLAASAIASAARADEIGEALADLAAPIGAASLNVDLSDATARAAEPPTEKSADAGEQQRALGYGRAGSRWWTVGIAWANDFDESNDLNIHGAFSTFLADDLEFALEGAAWYFHQLGDDTGGLSASMVFRWHFLHAADYNWSIFGDAGIGILGSFDNVPAGGTGFNFLPRIGAGFTKALSDSIDGESLGARFMLGVRYHHISNGRISGDSHNPARDALCVYAAITFPF